MLNATIGICAYNEEKNIDVLLDRLSNEKFNFNLKEIIVVANGCTDRTEDVVKKFAEKNEKIKIIVKKINRGKAPGINLILKNAKGEIIVFCDADNLPEKNSINKLIRPFSQNNVGSATSRIVPIVDPNLLGSLIELFWHFHHRAYIQTPKMGGQLCAIRKGIVSAIPDNVICDDAYMEAIVRRKKLRTIYVSDAKTYSSTPKTVNNFLKQRRKVKRGYNQLIKMNLNVSASYKTIFELVVKEIEKNPSNVFKISFVIFLEILASVLAHYDDFMKKTTYYLDKVN